MRAEQFLLRQLDELDLLPAVRAAIVELIRQKLGFLPDSLSEWEKAHLTCAIGALALNIDAPQQPTKDWLRLCLTHLGMVFTPPEERNSLCLDLATAAEDVNQEKLRQALESVARKIDLLPEFSNTGL